MIMTIELFQKLLHPIVEGLLTGFAYVIGAAADSMVIRETGTSLDLKLVLGLGAGIYFMARWMQRQTDEIKAIKKQIETLASRIESASGGRRKLRRRDQ